MLFDNSMCDVDSSVEPHEDIVGELLLLARSSLANPLAVSSNFDFANNIFVGSYHAYQGQEQLDIEAFLRMMSVQFVRAKQHTILPYPFHLIDLYVENFLRFGRQQSQ